MIQIARIKQKYKVIHKKRKTVADRFTLRYLKGG